VQSLPRNAEGIGELLGKGYMVGDVEEQHRSG
jgi:hypothetical protein